VVLQLLDIDTLVSTGIQQTLYWAHNATVDGTNFTGYFVLVKIIGPPAAQFECTLTGTLNWNAWNTIEYVAGPPNSILFNGVSAGSCASSSTGTQGTVTLGVNGDYPWTVYFDNVEVFATRSGP
jgi:hypothetical protein